jgi:hypothetical protein
MPNKSLPSPELLRKLLRYDPDTGKLYWRERTSQVMPDGNYRRRWNNRFSGKEAMTAPDGHGYFVGRIFGKKHLAHRVIWAMVNNEWPIEDIDHINGSRGDNRIENLRHVSRVENSRNSAMKSNNTSGVVGVSWSRRDKRWRAGICIDGKEIFIGNFIDKADAIKARKNAEVAAGFHPNHGRKSNPLPCKPNDV